MKKEICSENKEDKGKNLMQKGKHWIQHKGPQQVNDSKEEAELKRMEKEGVKIPFVLLAYMPHSKLCANPVKESKEGKFSIYALLILEEVPFDSEMLGKIPQLKMEYWDYNNTIKYPQFKTSR